MSMGKAIQYGWPGSVSRGWIYFLYFWKQLVDIIPILWISVYKCTDGCRYTTVYSDLLMSTVFCSWTSIVAPGAAHWRSACAGQAGPQVLWNPQQMLAAQGSFSKATSGHGRSRCNTGSCCALGSLLFVCRSSPHEHRIASWFVKHSCCLLHVETLKGIFNKERQSGN